MLISSSFNSNACGSLSCVLYTAPCVLEHSSLCAFRPWPKEGSGKDLEDHVQTWGSVALEPAQQDRLMQAWGQVPAGPGSASTALSSGCHVVSQSLRARPRLCSRSVRLITAPPIDLIYFPLTRLLLRTGYAWLSDFLPDYS